MTRKSNYIGTTETGNLSALGSAQQRDYNFVKDLLNRNDLIKYFAEPSVQEHQEKIDWYTEAHGKIVSFQNFTTDQVQRARDELSQLIQELSSLALAAENQVDRQAIENLSVLPDKDSIKMVGNQVTIINWAYRLHKRAKGDRQSSNFGGFLAKDTEINNPIETNADVSLEQNMASNAFVSAKNVISSPNTSEIFQSVNPYELKETSPGADQDIDVNMTDDYRPLLNKLVWFLLLLFFLLLIIVIILLKDACGVKGLPFLYFC